jgi:DNA-binding HxlR family transcriptional regulator
MKGYGQFCPVAKAAEIVAERWTPLVLRELCYGSTRFNELRRGVPLMSPSLLSRRLKDLEQAGIVFRTKHLRSWEYRLTPAGLELAPVIEQLGIWGKRWVRADIDKGDLDAGLLMWDMHRKLHQEKLPAGRTVLRFDFSGTTSGKRRWWLVIENGEVDLCLHDPGFDVDLHVRTSLRTMTRIWLGDDDLEHALREHALALEGPRTLVQAFPSWLKFSAITRVERMV